MPRPEDEIVFHSPALCSGSTGIVDITNCVIKGVSLITGDCVAEGHDLIVDDTTVSQLHALAKTKGKVPVNLDHGSGIKDMNGYVSNFHMDGVKMRGDWHLLKNHAETQLMMERAMEMPECFGLSVAFKGKGVAVKGGKKAARAEKLLSVDCVTRPAANNGLFSAKDRPTVDINKKDMDKTGQQENAEPTIQDVMKSLGEISTRLGQFEQVQNQLVEHVNQGVEDQGVDRDVLEKLHNCKDEELPEGVTRADVDAAVKQYNDSIDAETDGEVEETAGADKGEEGRISGGQSIDTAAAGAAAGAGAEGGMTGAELKALRKEVIELRSIITADKAKAAKDVEELQFSEIETKMTTLAQQRDQAIELAERLVAENEMLTLANRTGVRPVKAGVNDGERLFSAGPDGELHEFQTLVKSIMTEKKVTEGKAIQLAMKTPTGPALHADWLQLQSQNNTIRA